MYAASKRQTILRVVFSLDTKDERGRRLGELLLRVSDVATSSPLLLIPALSAADGARRVRAKRARFLPLLPEPRPELASSASFRRGRKGADRVRETVCPTSVEKSQPADCASRRATPMNVGPEWAIWVVGIMRQR